MELQSPNKLNPIISMNHNIVSIYSVQSTEITDEANSNGIKEIVEIASNWKLGDDLITIYLVGCVRVADTSSGALWEDTDSMAFFELLESESICI